MALINITNIIVENNPSFFMSPFSFKITFECNQDLRDEVEWRLIYVGSSKDEKYDQILDSFSMDNLKAGVMQFQLEVRKKYLFYLFLCLYIKTKFFFYLFPLQK
jgi:histone chaperone ASF1